MGFVHVEIEVSADDVRWIPVRFLVDSGAAYSVLPEDAWRELGLSPRRSVDFVLADGRPIRRQVSDCRFRYRSVDAPSPVVLGEENDVALLGVVTLETLGLVLNPFDRSLEPMRLMLA
jgi:predicted aspartyl protease